MSDVVGIASAAVVWAAALYRLPALWRRPRDLALRSYWATLLFLALAMTVLYGPIYVTLDRAVGRPNIARLLGNAFGLAACWAVQAFLVRLNYEPDDARPRVRLAGWFLAAALLLMGALFSLAPIHEEALAFETRYAGAPFVLEYRLVFFAYVAFALVNVVRLAERFARQADRPSLCHGLHLVATGSVCGLAYLAIEATRLVAAQVGARAAVPGVDAVAALLILGAAGLTVAGSTMPAWGKHLRYDRLVRWLRSHRTYRRLFPLWRDLCRASPEVALAPPAAAPLGDLWPFDLDFRLYRRVVEIRDAQLVLRAYLDPDTVARAKHECEVADLSADEVEAAAEAVCLAVAIRRRLNGALQRGRLDTTAVPQAQGMEGEVRAIERLATLYRHSPVVLAVAASLSDPANAERPIRMHSRR